MANERMRSQPTIKHLEPLDSEMARRVI